VKACWCGVGGVWSIGLLTLVVLTCCTCGTASERSVLAKPPAGPSVPVQKSSELATLQRAIQGPPNGRSSLQTDPAVLTRYGELALEAGKKSDADEAFTKATRNTVNANVFSIPMQIDPKDFPDESSRRALAHYVAGSREFINGRNPEALADLDMSVRLAPKWALGHFAYGVVLFDRGQRLAAIREVNLAKTLATGPLEDYIVEQRRELGLNTDEVLMVHIHNGRTTTVIEKRPTSAP
jgi:hypothetical protein